ncbi:MAG TPA: FecR domain-containing protein [Gemmataceae bacterium]|nr:FecR domain-containing protein [Gemmataceae bacterium]
MNTTPDLPDDLKDLIDDYLADRLDEAGMMRLEDRLRAGAEARRYFVAYCRLHTDLHLEMRARRVGERALRAIGEAAPPRRRLFASFPVKIAAAAAVLLAVGVAWWLISRPAPAEAPEVAWLVNAQDCRWAEDTPPAGPMRAGSVLRVERGLAEIQFRSGARVVLEGPAALELLSANGARLLRGKLSARVPEPAVGFEVLSPRGKVVDLGTEFGVAVGDDGATDVRVFVGQVKASAGGDPVSLKANQSAHLDGDGVTLRPDGDGGFVRAIVPPPVIVPRVLKLDFRRPVAGSLQDRAGRGTGLTHRLPGTGRRLAASDDNLLLDTDAGQLSLTTTNSDINHQFHMGSGEYLGVRLADLGFTGPEDFAVTVAIPKIPALKRVGQFGLYAGTKSDRNIRGGVISKKEPGQYTQFLVNNNGGLDTDVHFVGLSSVGDDLRLTLKRADGKYTLTVANETTGGSTTLAIRHPDFLDRETDLYVGLFGANTMSEERKTLVIKEVQVTVWTATPAR